MSDEWELHERTVSGWICDTGDTVTTVEASDDGSGLPPYCWETAVGCLEASGRATTLGWAKAEAMEARAFLQGMAERAGDKYG